MKLATVATAALFGLASYLMLELVFGSYGVIPYGTLERRVEHAEMDLAAVRAHQRALENEVRLLTTDPERIVLEAREIGLVGANESIVRISGWEPRSSHRAQAGTLPAPRPVPEDHRSLFRSIALALTLVVILVDTFSGTVTLPRRSRRREDEWDVELDQTPFSARHSR
jgi:cell division protein FtsB